LTRTACGEKRGYQRTENKTSREEYLRNPPTQNALCASFEAGGSASEARCGGGWGGGAKPGRESTSVRMRNAIERPE